MQVQGNFEISAHAVKKQARVFKSVLKLDKNFHIYIHGDRNKIEHGVDEQGRKFYKIFYEQEADTSSPDGYTMAHSPSLYLIGPDGEWLRQFTYGTSAAEIVSDLLTRL